MYRWWVLMLVACAAASPRPASDAVDTVNAVDAANVASPRIRAAIRDNAALGKLWAELKDKAPLVEAYPGDPSSRLVTFVFRSRARYVGMIGAPMVGDRPMIRIGTSDTHYLTARVPAESHFDYAFSEADNPPPLHERVVPDQPRSVDARYAARLRDPNNPNVHGGSSRVDLPGPLEPGPWLADDPATPRGTLTSITITSAVLGEPRRVSVYVPPGSTTSARRPILVAFDGDDYGIQAPADVPLPRILDNLIAAKKIPPVVVALVSTREQRRRDLFSSEPFAQFVVAELIPRLQTEFNGTLDAAQTIVTGSSLGGNQALYLGIHHARVVGNVLTSSAALWQRPHQFDGDPPDYLEGNALTHELATTPVRPVRFYIGVGLFENHLRDANRQLRLVLQAKGYAHHYVEFPGGHDPSLWAHTLADGLIELLGSQEGLDTYWQR